MDKAAPPPPQQSIISLLEETHQNLRFALNATEAMNTKIRGAQPEEAGEPANIGVSLRSLAQELCRMSCAVRSDLDYQHEVIGNHGAGQAMASEAGMLKRSIR